ncbi:hypothetical protein J3R74_001072 [Puniceicoccus vermicola]|uniref:Uncharacterized protein n=1 Tax=Puniceicoccus vermicola TaxID=388746 RepID=A0A7X1AYC2_9BACT|nr:hypothetical protein [Puniceicoccus vermicola]MBC2602217.1 hypothetical protein [Puniceicoccus vermicola]
MTSGSAAPEAGSSFKDPDPSTVNEAAEIVVDTPESQAIDSRKVGGDQVLGPVWKR